MNFIFLFAVLTVAGLVLGIFIENKASYSIDDWCYMFYGVGFVSLVILLIMIGVCVVNNATAASDNCEMLETQKALEFKLENADIRDEFGLLNKSFVDDVETYNRKIVRYKVNSENPWLSAFYPKKLIEGCERIDYERFSVK